MRTIAPPTNCPEVDKFWENYFENLAEGKEEFSEVSFLAETVPPKPSFWQKVFKKIPQPQTVTVTMKEFDPNRIMVRDAMISIYSTEEEVNGIRSLKLNEEIVNCSYVMTILPKRHKVCFHIGNLTELKIAS
jgi:hypothetical protein